MRRASVFGVVGVAVLIAGVGCELIGGAGDLTFVDDVSGGHGGAGAHGGGQPGGGGTGAAGGGTGGNTGGGHTGGGGGVQPTCGDSVVDAGELCFTAPYAAHAVGAVGLGDMVLVGCDADQDLDVVVTTKATGNSVNLTFLTNSGDGTLVTGASAATGLDTPAFVTAANTDGAPGDELLAAGNTVGFGPTFAMYDDTSCQLGSPTFQPGLGGLPTDVGAVQFGGDAKDDPVSLVQGTPPQLSFHDTVKQPLQVTKIDAESTAVGGLDVGDLDGNQYPDLVFVDPAANTVVVRINTGTGFAAASSIAAGTGPAAVAVGDIDGGNHDDVVVANATDNTVTVLLNNGSATLSFGSSLSIEPSGNVPAAEPRAIALADMDADGDLDIVTANSGDSGGKSSVSLFIGDGLGNFVAATTANVPSVAASFPIEVGRQPTALALADMNGDGAIDIVTASVYVNGGSSDVSVLLAQP